MTITELCQLLSEVLEHPVPPDRASIEHAATTLKAQNAAYANDPVAQQARLSAIEALSSYAQLPTTLAGIHREQLIRWDGWTSTWIGRSVQTGRVVQIRALRPEHRQNAAYQRLLEDEASRLRRVQPRISTHWDDWPLILLPAPGHRAERPSEASSVSPDVTRLAQLLGSGLDHIKRWHEAQIGIPKLDAQEIRRTDGGLHITCLTPAPQDAVADAITTISLYALEGRTEAHNALEEVALGFCALPPQQPAEAITQWKRALAQVLVSSRHRVFKHHRSYQERSGASRLYAIALRLMNALPAPEGRAAIGVNLDGCTTIIEGKNSRLTFGPVDHLESVYDKEDGFSPQVGRKMLRARAAVPLNEALQTTIGGDLIYADRACRWTSAGLHLRTLLLLLKAQLSAHLDARLEYLKHTAHDLPIGTTSSGIGDP